MHIPRSLRWCFFAVAVLVGLPVCYYNFILDWQGRPYCHKQVYSSFLVWMDEHKATAFPNVGGLSAASLAEINEEMASSVWSRNYKYVPGLRRDDPGDLVLMYMDRPTRWTWHGAPPTVFRDRQWILVPVDFKTERQIRAEAGPGELSERVSLVEFRNRLKRTLDFVRTNDRPNWQTVVAEHTKILESIEHVNR